MATVVLFHSVYGPRRAVHSAAERIGEAGHEVLTPDLFDGRTARSVTEGTELRDEIGRDELLRRAVAYTAPYSDRGLVYAGFSLGGAVAQNLAIADEKARGLLLLHGTSDLPEELTLDELPVQLHVAEPDPFETEDWLNTWYLRLRRAGGDVEIHRYPGAGHLFTDPELDDYDPEAAERALRTAVGFLDTV